MRALIGIAFTILALGGATMALADPDVTFVPVSANIHDATLKDIGDGSFEIVTTGADPYVFLRITAGALSKDLHVLAFEYASPQGTDALQVYVFPPLDEAHSVTGRGISLSEGWTTHSLDIAPALADTAARPEGVRLDFGNHPGKVVRIRSIRLRAPNERERELAAREEARKAELKAHDTRLGAYLARKFGSTVSEVRVDARQITVSGSAALPGTRATALYLAEVPMWADVTALKASPHMVSLPKPGPFKVTVPRHDGVRDRLTSRWAVVRKQSAGLDALSSARYPDAVAPVHAMPFERPRGKKGLGGFGLRGPVISDLDDLGIAAVTVNILLNGLVSTRPGAGRAPFEYGGRTYYANDGVVADYDRTLAETSRRGLIVSAIILIAHGYNAPEGDWSRLVAHPDAHPSGIFVMPNIESEEGVLAYGAALDYLAKRYSTPDNRHGRIHHYILHNEINAGWIWTNAGDKTDRAYMDLYHRSMRLTHLIARQYDANAQAFISLEHHWNYTPEPRFYRGKRLLELLLDYSRAEGDFDWALAFHPYPDSLLVPRTWEDGHTDFTLDTPKITFRNIEVLGAWSKLKTTWFRGRKPRTIHCTEQGLNSPDYSGKSLRDQAAGMAYTWKKLKVLDCIEAFQYHNWIDNRGEFGLRIGLRKFPDEPGDPFGKKPIWHVFAAMGTDREDEVFAPYLEVVGVKSWDEVVHRAPIK